MCHMTACSLLNYIAIAGEIYGAERRMASLAKDYPKLVRKETLLEPSDLRFFQIPNFSSSWVCLLGTGMDTQDTSPSVLLFFDKQRFIFNAVEGLQRFCTEHKIKLSKEKWRFKERSYGS
ncbi:unnamed protein product [Prunus armeniaca]